MNPQLVNAVNLPGDERAQLPGGASCSRPYFDPTRPAVMDYGATGSVIGHEISHSFDDQGALFDADGRLKNWWTKDDFAHFTASAEALVRQYDAYRPFPDLAVNGKLTLSENIADVAGLAAAYDAYRISLGGKEAPAYQGLTGDQQFFLSFAQSWRTKFREPALRQRIVDRRPRAGRVPRRHRPQPRRLVHRVRREAGAGALPRAARPRPRVVSVTEPFSTQECASLYLSWRLGRPLQCPTCLEEVTSAEEPTAGWSRTRRFTCTGCGRNGAHHVPDDASGPIARK